ncbi:unnamed protein product [Ambrosiozyma monospora]|uniref:Unnamed protein product n=1 Tax=Ambrosiozyma monospora TaxID=43982 RepID=A0ACB5T7I8_AMBMO|nr:unnamed protein product [Ambrosiozyma monospora]
MSELEYATKFQELIQFVTPTPTYDKLSYSEDLNQLDFSNRKVCTNFLNYPIQQYKFHLYDTNQLSNISTQFQFNFPKLANVPIFTQSSGTAEKDSSLESKPIQVTFKSLRAPKFKLELTLQSNILLHKVKLELIKALETHEPEPIYTSASNVKLMLKTKTVHDGETLSSLAGDSDVLNLNVIISKSSVSPPVETKAPVTTTVAVTETKFSGLSDEAWSQIEKLVKKEVEDEKLAIEYLGKLKAVVP